MRLWRAGQKHAGAGARDRRRVRRETRSGVNSGTDALLLSLLALGIGPGDEVITSPFTFIATGETICLAGATPVFADIDPQTFNLDPDAAAAKITPRTKAILPVHLFGQLADMTRFCQLGAQRSLALLGDAAQAIGASHGGKPLGAWGDANTLSFYPTKNLGPVVTAAWC